MMKTRTINTYNILEKYNKKLKYQIYYLKILFFLLSSILLLIIKNSTLSKENIQFIDFYNPPLEEFDVNILDLIEYKLKNFIEITYIDQKFFTFNCLFYFFYKNLIS